MDFVTELYREYVLFVHAHKSTLVPGRYLASFIASKDGVNVADVTVDADFADAAGAKATTMQTARECVDELIAD
ncbi:hypothetical protein [Massilia phyllosphaerae]|jgi:hypothetical protein|uniref:hypothetical protein n=1 Tax=Massilia phyllosphaerae TaxID=3106034 RepID=UPI002B1CB316|nr:hypothetical protein [Massilia sp. SGZ-792]